MPVVLSLRGSEPWHRARSRLLPSPWCPCARGLIAGLPAGLLTGAGNATGFQEQQLALWSSPALQATIPEAFGSFLPGDL